jgi:hypothetical protein
MRIGIWSSVAPDESVFVAGHGVTGEGKNYNSSLPSAMILMNAGKAMAGSSGIWIFSKSWTAFWRRLKAHFRPRRLTLEHFPA